MSEAARLRELEEMARRLASGTTDPNARAKLLEVAEAMAADALLLEEGTDSVGLNGVPPLPASGTPLDAAMPSKLNFIDERELVVHKPTAV